LRTDGPFQHAPQRPRASGVALLEWAPTARAEPATTPFTAGYLAQLLGQKDAASGRSFVMRAHDCYGAATALTCARLPIRVLA